MTGVLHSSRACVGATLCTSPETRTHTTQRMLTQPPQTSRYAICSFLLTDFSCVCATVAFGGSPSGSSGAAAAFAAGRELPSETIHRLSTGAPVFAPLSARAAASGPLTPSPRTVNDLRFYLLECRIWEQSGLLMILDPTPASSPARQRCDERHENWSQVRARGSKVRGATKPGHVCRRIGELTMSKAGGLVLIVGGLTVAAYVMARDDDASGSEAARRSRSSPRALGLKQRPGQDIAVTDAAAGLPPDRIPPRPTAECGRSPRRWW